ncbi:MAG: beta-galactosidase [Terracidiphilus sp.]
MRSLLAFFIPFVLICTLTAQPSVRPLIFDAAGSNPAPRPVSAQLGSNRSPDGAILGANSQYLTRDGKPWIPVMGEFHYSRYPEAYWEEEILKMKASGVQVVATYVFWIHHEEIEGQFDWSGQRNLRKFAELCAKHNMLLYPRIGPWAHGEVRNGGLPDWVLAKSPVRSNDPVYLAEVRRFYAQIGQQLHGLLWKDGGPVIGIQIENEYALNGPGQGREHLAALRQIAIESGFDVPLYTVTGWDNAVVPADLFLPVYGGYSDAPWDPGKTTLPPAEVFAFRFDNRVASNLEASASSGDRGLRTTALDAVTPFLTAEVGGGIEDTYYRRPLLATSDVAAMFPVMVGSGANLLGYYMYQGGENPDGLKTTLQESQRTSYPTDVPEKSYDFQAPLGEFGQMNPSLRELKLYHYFLNDYGAQLAKARVIQPSQRPTGPGDQTVVRASARFDAERGFLFVNHYVRHLDMPARPGTQFELRLPGSSLLVPAKPFTLPANSYFFWPVNLDVDGVTLIYATAEPILKICSGGETYLFFSAIPGIAAEFAFPTGSQSALQVEKGSLAKDDQLIRVLNVEPGLGSAITVHGKKEATHIVLLSRDDASNLWRIKINGHDQLVLTKGQVFSDGSRLALRQIGDPSFDVSFFPAVRPAAGNGAVAANTTEAAGIFQHLAWREAERKISLQIEQTRGVGKAPAPELNPESARPGSAPVRAPEESSFTQAGEWRVVFAQRSLAGLSDAFLRVSYQGDEARLLNGNHLLTDNFFNGTQWQIGMKRFLAEGAAKTFTLQVLPLSQQSPVVFDPGKSPAMGTDGQAGSLQSVEAIPEYEMDLSF